MSRAGLRVDLFRVVHRWYPFQESASTDTSVEWRWRLWSSSSIVGASREGYRQRARAIANLETVTGGVFEKISTPDFPTPYGVLRRIVREPIHVDESLSLAYLGQRIPVRLVVE